MWRLRTSGRGFMLPVTRESGRGVEARPATWAPFGAGGASGATGYLDNGEEVARARHGLLTLLATLGRSRRHGCWTEPMLGRADRWGISMQEKVLPKESAGRKGEKG